MTNPTLLVLAVGIIIGFMCGVVIGIIDCKRRFGIPKGAMPDDGNASNADD